MTLARRQLSGIFLPDGTKVPLKEITLQKLNINVGKNWRGLIVDTYGFEVVGPDEKGFYKVFSTGENWMLES